MTLPPVDDLEIQLADSLAFEEGVRYFVYDDATGKTFRRGDTLKGNLTAMVGVNLMNGFDADDVKYFLAKRIAAVRRALGVYAWYQKCDMVRQGALCDLAFNLGVAGLLHWPDFLVLIAQQRYSEAADWLRDDVIYVSQVGPRAARIESMLTTGVWPSHAALRQGIDA